jgi:MoaA/NifB/PqqE/SkfB family radical SAM enzyme
MQDKKQKKFYKELSNIVPVNPKSINLELTNNCNLRCIFCLNSLHNFRKKGFMSDEIFYKLINEASEDTTIIICGIGEPTLHNKFDEYVTKLSDKFKNIFLVTNGHFENKRIRTILNSNITKVTFSLDFFDKDAYCSNKNGKIDKVIKNIESLLKLRGSRNMPILQINMLMEKGKEKQIKDCLLYFNAILGKDDFVYSRNVKSLSEQIKVETIDNYEDWLSLEKIKKIISKDVNTDKYFVENWCNFLGLEEPLSSRQVCRHPFIYAMVLYDGRVVFCCIDFNAKMIAGDLKFESLQEIWNGKKYNNFRSDMINFRFDAHPLCINCTEWYKQK